MVSEETKERNIKTKEIEEKIKEVIEDELRTQKKEENENNVQITEEEIKETIEEQMKAQEIKEGIEAELTKIAQESITNKRNEPFSIKSVLESYTRKKGSDEIKKAKKAIAAQKNGKETNQTINNEVSR